MADSTIRSDVQTSGGDFAPDNDGFDAFLSSFNDDPKKGPSESDEGASTTQDETPAGVDHEQDGEADQGSADPDDQEVEIKVGEETKKATLRDLKRLYGQEAALTQKSQRASELQREAEANLTRASEATKALLERANERWKPYQELDWLVLSQQFADNPEAFQQLRMDAAEAKRDVDFLTQELDGHMQKVQEKASAAYREAAEQCIRTLTDPKTGIEGFGKPLYDEMMTFATDNGLPTARSMTSAPALKLLHMAMLYAKSQKAAKDAEQKVTKAREQPQRVLKPGAGKQQTGGKREAMSKLRQDGSLDNAADAFLASF